MLIANRTAAAIVLGVACSLRPAVAPAQSRVAGNYVLLATDSLSVDRHACRAFALQPALDPVTLLLRKPFRFRWFVWKIGEKKDAEQNGGQPFDKEEPLPTGQTETALKIE